MKIVITLDVTNDPDEMGVSLDCLPEALIEHAFMQVLMLGLKPENLICSGIGAKIVGDKP